MNKNIIPILIVIGLLGCTGNSIFDDEISSLDGYSFHGIVKIAGSSDAENVYIWLEAFNIGAWSDSTGAFELHIPPAKTQSGRRSFWKPCASLSSLAFFPDNVKTIGHAFGPQQFLQKWFRHFLKS